MTSRLEPTGAILALPRILIVEDDPAVSRALCRSLRVEGYLTETADNGELALDLVPEFGPDVVVMDVMMPLMDGFQTCRLLRARSETVPVLMLTARDAISDRVYGLDSGAQDYLAKPFAMEELLARIRVLVRDHRAALPTRRTFADLSLDVSSRQAWRGERELTLTKTEFELLLVFVDNPTRVLSRSRLQSEVWGQAFDIASNSLDVFISGLRKKLEEGGEPRLLTTSRGIGYVLRT